MPRARPQVVCLDIGTVDWGDLDRHTLEAMPVSWHFFEDTKPEACLERLKAADVVVTNKVRLGASLMAELPHLRCILSAATGVDHIDVVAANQQGIVVSNVRGYATQSVAQHTLNLMLSLVTKQHLYQQAVTVGRWQASGQFCLRDHPIETLAGKTLGIVGYGELGKAVAKLADAFGMNVKLAMRDASDKREGRMALEQLLSESDIVSLHCPLTPETKGLISADRLALMKPAAYLVNTARGALIDEKALRCTLEQRKIAGAGLDVLSEEPPGAGHLLISAGLPNLIITPHTAWAARPARQALLEQLAGMLQAFLNDKPIQVVSA